MHNACITRSSTEKANRLKSHRLKTAKTRIIQLSALNHIKTLAALLVMNCETLSLEELAEFLKRDFSGLSQAARRIERRVGTDSLLARKLEKVTKSLRISVCIEKMSYSDRMKHFFYQRLGNVTSAESEHGSDAGCYRLLLLQIYLSGASGNVA